MDAINHMNFDKICRVCLKENSKLRPLFEASVAKMLMMCTTVVAIEGDGLPSQICTQCILMVSRAFNFKQMCEKSDEILRQYIAHNNEKLAESIDKTQMLLSDNMLVSESCSVYTDMFMKSTDTLVETLEIDHSTLSTDVTQLADTMQSMAEQCLPSLWDIKRTADMSNSNTMISEDAFANSTIYLSSCNNSLNLPDQIQDPNKSKKSYTCEVCGKIYLDLRTLKKHLKEQHSNQNGLVEPKQQCCTCGKRYRYKKQLLIHMRTHTGERPLMCEICNKSFALPSSLQKHRLIHSEEKKYKCTICNKGFHQSSNFCVHMRVHTGEKSYTCTICGKSLASKTNLDVHIRIHCGEKPYSCNSCDRSFTSRTELIKHQYTHTDNRPYSCMQCGKAFRRKETRDTHVRYHTGERPFACTICPKRYIARNHLQSHMLIHTGERRHQCSICGKRFMEKRSLNIHVRTHTGEKPFVCMICDKAFSQSGTLTTHMKEHKDIC